MVIGGGSNQVITLSNMPSGTGGTLPPIVADEIGGIKWKSGKVYEVGVVVTYNNVAYKCIVVHTSVSWASNINNWEFIISDPGKF